MIKVIGSILIIGGTATIGLKKILSMDNRVKALSSMISALEIMQSEILFRLTPIPELLQYLSETASGPSRIFFENCCREINRLGEESLLRIWKKALKNTPELELHSEEERALLDLGAVLGKYDLDGQGRAIAYAVSRLEKILQDAKTEKQMQSKVYGIMGIAAGLAVVIIFI